MEVFVSYLVRIVYLVLLCMIPGSFVAVGAVWVWKGLRRLANLQKPTNLPLRTPTGSVIYTEDDWRREVREERPVRYALFESLPRALARLGRRVKRSLSRRSPRHQILSQAFGTFSDWVETHWDRVNQDLPVVDSEDGLAARYNTRMAEIRELYEWWKTGRPADVIRLDEQSRDVREFNLVDLELDDQHNLARLANVWRDLT